MPASARYSMRWLSNNESMYCIEAILQRHNVHVFNIYNMASRCVSAIYDPNTEILAQGEAEG